jgi:toxin ParE1/3/4
MARLVRSALFKRDLIDVLAYTKERWGLVQARSYGALVQDALVAIARDAECGKPRDDVRAGLRALHIRQAGRPARHIIFYKVRSPDVIDIVRLLHDGMDFARHVP